MALKKRKGSKVPYSTARTSYGLLTDVIRAILDEPKRVYMGDWKMSSFNMAIFLADKGVKKGPACGTIGCISGWITTLDPKQRASAMFGENVIAPLAGLVIGSPEYDRRYQMRRALTYLFVDVHVPADYGTKKYAQIVADRIKTFQKQWAVELKAINI